MKNIFLIFALCFLTGCSTISSTTSGIRNQETLSFDFASTPTLQVRNRVVRGDQVVSIHPNVNLENSGKVLFVPFGITQDASQAQSMSEGISRIIWQQFLEVQAFPVIEFGNILPPYRVENALSFAQSKGADFLIGGYITYFFDGGTTGSTRIALILELYDVANGNLLWSIAHGGEMPYEATRDFILLQVKTSMPFDPTYAVVSTLGMDIARLISAWSKPASPEFKSKSSAF